MKITFVSNYINHHQIPISDRLYEKLGEEYCFIQTEPIEQERLEMGWGDEVGKLPYLRLYYEDEAACKELILSSDIVIFGGTDNEDYILPRLESGKPVLRYSERLYKTGQWKWISPRGLKKKYHDHIRFRKAPVYLLCAGGYVADDFHLIHAYPDKMLKWGYFPAFKEQDVDKLLAQKEEGSILWAGRFLDWKHPELAVMLAKKLRKEGIPFHLTMIGGGQMEEEIVRLIAENDLEKYITLTGFLSPHEVRTYMEKASVYVFTSDYQEGWGAVLNEAMNSACGVAASHAIGASPYLIRHGQNGFVFESGQVEDLTEQVKKLLADKEGVYKRAAYETIRDMWNPRVAADRLLLLATQLAQKGAVEVSRFAEGPCSKASVIREKKMLQTLRGKK